MPIWYHKHILNMPTPGPAVFFMLVYIDESGDLGWTFDKPYRDGGSSRYLTISFLLTPSDSSKYPKRVVRDLYNKFKIPTKKEIKGTDLSNVQRTFFVKKVIDLILDHPEIRILCITVNKMNVADHIQKDPNKLYNYMIGLALLDEISQENSLR